MNWVFAAFITNYQKLDGLQQQQFILSQFRGQEPEIKELARLCLLQWLWENLFHACVLASWRYLGVP